jgi:hypothetical protein
MVCAYDLAISRKSVPTARSGRGRADAEEPAAAQAPPLVEGRGRFVRVLATAEGESRFEDIPLDRTLPPGDHTYILHRHPASEARLLLVSTDWTPIKATASPRYFVILQGSCAIQTSDQAIETFVPGDLVLLEDCTGRGHRTGGQGLALVIILETTRI